MDERNYTIEELEQAIVDLLDGESEWDIQYGTGLEIERCKELRDLYEKVWDHLNANKLRSSERL